MSTYPVRSVAARRPVTSQGFDLAHHLGVDIMFARIPSDPPYQPTDPRGTRGFYVPPGVVVVAPESADIIYAKRAPNGFRVRLHLANGAHLCFFHLARLDVADMPSVAEGQVLGLMGGDPTQADPHHTVHLHFERREPSPGAGLTDGWGMRAVDPAQYLAACAHVIA